MLPRQPSASQAPRRFGVGIDTSRYGHYAAFLNEDLQPAAAELQFPESAAGYALLRERLERLAQRHGPAHFLVRLDAAGQYADNLRHFLHGLANRAAGAAAAPASFSLALSCGDPQRNKNYRAALFGSQKSDPVEARAAARFALTERPTTDIPLSQELRTLRQVAGRLQAVVRQRTRLLNQFHHLLALTFPELALLTKDLAAGWVLELVHRYPTAPLLAAATPAGLATIAYLPDKHVAPLLEQARCSIASLAGATAAELVREQVRQLRESGARQKRLENLLVAAYHALPQPNHLDTIPGLGAVTAAVLTAFTVAIDRFATPAQLVAYFGTLPTEVASGVERDGQARAPRRWAMSRRGNDLVRRYLWMAALSAVRCNPAVQALYARVVAKHPRQKAVAVGHAMRKLLHLAFAVWKGGRPFDPDHYPWQAPAHAAATDRGTSREGQAAGHKPDSVPAQPVVTAACTDTVADAEAVGEGTHLDFAHLKRQLPLARVLDQLGLTTRLRGSGPQRRCACPLHRGDARGRTFSVNLDAGVWQCFAKECGRKGDVIDLWAAFQGLSLRAAALELVQTFGLEPAPRSGTEKRNG
ncbi:MAG TPA: transposase [Gemmataceae bacterium]|jgi:transposase|nr:transposase [Gemmataceae bacterium]